MLERYTSEQNMKRLLTSRSLYSSGGVTISSALAGVGGGGGVGGAAVEQVRGIRDVGWRSCNRKWRDWFRHH